MISAKCKNIFSWLVVIVFSGCYGSRQISTENLSAMYRQGEHIFHPEFSVYHYTKDSSVLYVKLKTDELLKVRQADGFKSLLRLQCKLVESFESSVLLDSVSADFIVEPVDSTNQYRARLFTVPLKVPLKGSFLLSCSVIDLNKKTTEEYFINIDRESDQSRQCFFVSSLQPDVPLFRNFITALDTFQVKFNDPDVDTLYVRYYQRFFPLSPPPFSFDVNDKFNYTPDSTFTIGNGQPALNFPREGFYHFQADTVSGQGLTLFRFKNGFPSVTTPEQMIEATRYLTSKKEFEAITTSSNKKGAVDKFWLSIGGNQERTRQLIKKYYSRIREANKLFTSYTEGWRTDRGMVYIIFGSPNFVYKNSISENWIYGQPNNALALSFFFTRVNNPFTDNDFTLSRAPIYESSWYRAIDYWRQGRVYNDF